MTKARERRSEPGVVLKSLVGASRGRKSPIDPASRSFLFTEGSASADQPGGCFARVAGGVLTVTFPGPISARLGTAAPSGGVRWSAPRAVARTVDVHCPAGAPTPFNRRALPKDPAPPSGTSVRFHGAVRYCRLVLPEGPVLLVQGSVASITGLAGAARPFDTAEFFPAASSAASSARPQDSGIDPSGPHQPFP